MKLDYLNFVILFQLVSFYGMSDKTGSKNTDKFFKIVFLGTKKS